MKAKVKFDSAQLKGFMLHHVEKLVFGGFVVAFLLLCWSAFKLKPYDKTPDQLKATADRVSQDVEKATPPEKFADLPGVPDFTNLGAVGPSAVDPRMYKIDPLSRPYEDRQELRKEPKLLALEEPLVYAGYGGIAINEMGGVQRMATNGIGMGMDTAMSGGSGMGGPGGMASDMMQGMSSMPPPGMGMTSDGMAPGGEGMPGGMASGMMQGMSSMPPPGMGGAGGTGGMMPQGRGRRAPRRRTVKKEDKKPLPRPKPQVTEKIVLAQAPAGSKVEGRYWVCLVGAVPYRSQFIEYQNTFRDARGYNLQRDYPRYALPEIERAEVVGDKLNEWQSLDLEEALDDLKKWAAEYPDVIDKEISDPDLTEPLPPLIFANHDKAKVNHPRTKVEEKTTVAKVDTTKKKKPTKLSGTTVARPGDQSGYGATLMPAMTTAPGGLAAKLPEYRLFRFFDFAVQPGKTYRYRVKLMVENPNRDVQKRFLENYKFADGATRETDWSQPSGPITVIAGNRLLAGSVSTGTAGRGEPSGSVLAKLFDATEAIEVRKIFDIHRGSVLNQLDMEIGIAEPGSVQVAKQSAKVDFETNAVVLDMFGGEKLASAKGSKVPGHILVLDNDGEFKTLLQSSDSGMYETEEEEAKNQAPPKEGAKAPGAAAQGGTGFDGFGDFDAIQPGKKKPGKR